MVASISRDGHLPITSHKLATACPLFTPSFLLVHKPISLLHWKNTLGVANTGERSGFSLAKFCYY